MEEKHGNPGDQPQAYQAAPPIGYPAQPPPAYQGQPSQVAGQQPAGYQQQPGYPANAPPGYPVQQQPGYPVQQQPGYPAGQTQFVSGQQHVVITMPPANRVNNNLVLAIISTVCCCPLCGIIGIIYAAQVDSASQRGDIARAEANSSIAKRWSIAAIVGGCVWIAIVIIYYIIMLTSVHVIYN